MVEWVCSGFVELWYRINLPHSEVIKIKTREPSYELKHVPPHTYVMFAYRCFRQEEFTPWTVALHSISKLIINFI